MRIHRAADIHHQDDARIAPPRRTRHHFDLAGIGGGRIDGRLEIKLVLRALADERAELPECDLDLTRIKREIVPEPAIKPGVGDFNRSTTSTGAADTNPLRRLARMPKRARAAGADPFISAVVPLGLLIEPLFKESLQLFEIERFNERALFLAEPSLLLLRLFQPLEQLVLQLLRADLDSAEILRKGEVEIVVMRDVMNHRRAG